MSDKKIIAVVGATGAQGGGLVRAILNDPQGGFAVRAITRDVNSDQARALQQLGAEVAAADLGDEASLQRAFAGAHGAFCVTFFWAHFSPERELAEAGRMARAAQAAGVKHVIWSTLEDTRKRVPLSDLRMPTLQGKYKVPHFDGKGEADAEFTKLGLPLTRLLTSFYWDNFITFGMGPRKGADGSLTFALPMGDKRLPGIAAEDIGRCAYGIFQRGSSMIGRTIGISGEHLTGAQMAEALSKALGQKVVYQAVPSMCIAVLGSPAQMTWATCFSTSTTSKLSSAALAMSPSRANLILSCRRSPTGSPRMPDESPFSERSERRGSLRLRDYASQGF